MLPPELEEKGQTADGKLRAAIGQRARRVLVVKTAKLDNRRAAKQAKKQTQKPDAEMETSTVEANPASR